MSPSSARLGMVLLLAPLVLAGCDGPGDSAPPAEEPVPELGEVPVESPVGSWALDSFADGTPGGSPAGEGAITLMVLPDGRVAGSGGCNRYFGPWQAEGPGGMSLGLMGSTMMACPEEVMELERRYLTALAEVGGFRREGETLVLQDGEGRDLLIFRKGEEPMPTPAPTPEAEGEEGSP